VPCLPRSSPAPPQRAVAPDYAVVSIALTHVGPDPSSALDNVAERSHRLAQVVGELSIDRRDWLTDGVQLAEEWQWKNDANVLVGHRATTGATVTVRSPDVVGALLRDVVALCAATIRQTTWHVDVTNPVRHELLGEAARDAQRKAAAYAAALGLEVGDVELISEAPISVAPAPAAEAYEMRLAKADTPTVSIGDGSIEVAAVVHVRFGLLRGPS
jgi:uncharacterized protein